jgi:hypothetical protein
MYVSEYGNWGSEKVLVFDESDLNEFQLETLSVLPDYDKLPYVEAILNGDDLSQWEL